MKKAKYSIHPGHVRPVRVAATELIIALRLMPG
jgi:hypothetical protein